MDQPRALTLLIAALGGEGGGVLTEWIVEAARRAGLAAQATSIPGVAQRTGATTYYIEVFPVPMAQLAGRRPVFSLNPVPGQIDLLLASELLEAARQAASGMIAPDRSLVITSSARTLTTAERMAPGDGRADGQALQALVRAQARDMRVLDMQALAREAGTVVSAVMFGALIGSGRLPIPADAARAAIGDGPTAAASRRGFDAGLAAVGTGPERPAADHPTDDPEEDRLLSKQERDSHISRGSTPDFAMQFGEKPARWVALGHARVCEWQDAAYGRFYLDRLARLHAAAAGAADADAVGDALGEAARWLALWMAWDDVPRVAQLKARAARWQRVRAEARAQPDELLRLYDHFKPGVPEFAALLPPALARPLRALDARRVAAGREPLALPVKVATHSVAGLLALRALASLRHVRRFGQRWADEQALIERWLSALADGLARDTGLGLEIARCGRLIKGYGSTHARGQERLLHIVDHLAPRAASGQPAREVAQAIAQVREAALADASDARFNATLSAHGAPTRAPREQPIRFVRRPRDATAAPRG